MKAEIGVDPDTKCAYLRVIPEGKGEADTLAFLEPWLGYKPVAGYPGWVRLDAAHPMPGSGKAP